MWHAIPLQLTAQTERGSLVLCCARKAASSRDNAAELATIAVQCISACFCFICSCFCLRASHRPMTRCQETSKEVAASLRLSSSACFRSFAFLLQPRTENR